MSKKYLVVGNPIEHSLSPKLHNYWFSKNNIQFVSSIPSSDFDYDYKNLFDKKSVGSYYSRIVNQISMLFNKLGSDGGLFIVLGKKS